MIAETDYETAKWIFDLTDRFVFLLILYHALLGQKVTF